MRKATSSGRVGHAIADLARLADVQSQELARLITIGFDACAMPAVLYRPDDTIAYMNDALRRMLDLPPDVGSFVDVVRHAYQSGTGPALSMEPEAWLEMAAARRRSKPLRSFEVDMMDGRWFMVTESCIENGWLWDVYTDITSLKSNEQKLVVAHNIARQDAETDALTGAYNRRFAIAELNRQVTISSRTLAPLSVALIDLDHFKKINDTDGHLAGDAVLSHFAETVSWLVRRGDTFARYGGEEFLLVMPGASDRDAAAVVERFRQEVAASATKELCRNYTFSAGIAQRGECEDGVSVLNRADLALYAAKADGRNRSSIAPA